MLNACWLDLRGPPRRNVPDGGSRRSRRALGYVAPALAAAMLAALLFHVLAETVSLVRWSDPAGVMSALLGAAVALVVVMPVMARLTAQATHAWRRQDGPPSRGPGAFGKRLPKPPARA